MKRNDVAEISRLTHFPIDVDLANTEGFEGIENQDGFTRHFKTLFPEQTHRTLLNKTPKPNKADHLETWSISHDEPNEISEMEWSIIYSFTRFSNGEIKMTAIHFAG
ncbi:MAG: hypothetical protein V4727_05225 [Verrucomicrobiota bacterium]